MAAVGAHPCVWQGSPAGPLAGRAPRTLQGLRSGASVSRDRQSAGLGTAAQPSGPGSTACRFTAPLDQSQPSPSCQALSSLSSQSKYFGIKKVILRMVSPQIPAHAEGRTSFSHTFQQSLSSADPPLLLSPRECGVSVVCVCTHTLYKCPLHTHARTQTLSTNHSRHTEVHVVPGITLVSIFPWASVYL